LDVVGRLMTSLALPFHPKDHCDYVPMGLYTFLGLEMTWLFESCPAGMLSMNNLLLYNLVDI